MIDDQEPGVTTRFPPGSSRRRSRQRPCWSDNPRLGVAACLATAAALRQSAAKRTSAAKALHAAPPAGYRWKSNCCRDMSSSSNHRGPNAAVQPSPLACRAPCCP